MRERVLDLTLDRSIEAFEAFKWKFFEVEIEAGRGTIHIEVPRGSNEAFVVEVTCRSGEQTEAAIASLVEAGFIKQTIKVRPDW